MVATILGGLAPIHGTGKRLEYRDQGRYRGLGREPSEQDVTRKELMPRSRQDLTEEIRKVGVGVLMRQAHSARS